MSDFVPGQRWLSETQPELGLGRVTAVAPRRVELHFPATGETRCYAHADAPLARAAFEPGGRVRDDAGRELTVTAVRERDGLVTYLCEDLEGEAYAIPEAALDPHLLPNRPRQRLLAARFDRDLWFDLRYRTWLRGMEEAVSPVLGLVGPRASPIPHQLYIAAEVAGRHAPRVLLADEVGLGKTIEAGLILHRLLLTGRAARVLILVPEPLLHQWLVEMLRRFNLRFALFDRERLDAGGDAYGHGNRGTPDDYARGRHDPHPPRPSPTRGEGDKERRWRDYSDNPFLTEQRVLCPLGLLVGDPAAAHAVLEGEWDLLVVDEAHHLAWSQTAASPEHELVAALAARTPGVLLLTATPEQLGRSGHYGRLRLLDPHRFHDYDAFLAEEAHYAPVAALAGRLLDGEPLTGDDRTLLATLPDGLGALPPATLIERLLDRHGTGRVLFRNTRAAIPGFPRRELVPHPLPRPDAYAGPDGNSVQGLTPERLLDGEDWTAIDPRVGWLAQTLRRLRPEKLLAICAHAETLLDLRRALLEREGILAAAFHEGMEIVERDRAAAFFADPDEGAQVLLCSEIGSEGRNFQFAHHLVMFDLPLDPDLLEQRIGRLDRIGQRETIRIHVPYLTGGPGETLFRWYAEGLGAFSAVCPAAPAVFEHLRGELLAALADPTRTHALIAAARCESRRIDAELAAGRDRLLELHSHRPTESAALVDAVVAEDAGRSVATYMSRFWDAFGVEHEPGPGATVVLHPGAHMLHETFPGLPEDGLTATFDRGVALSHEDREFLTWEHPMARGAMELLTASDLGTCALTVLRDPRLAPGTLLLEMIQVAECPAPPQLEVGRFLPPTALRLLLDAEGRDLAPELEHEDLRGQCLSHNLRLGAAVIATKRPALEAMLARGETLAAEAAERLAREARERMEAELDAELDRLRALAQVNPSVRPDEIAFVESRRERLSRQLDRVRLHLDALRVIVTA
jgi:ATP-dependent helicase HepA